MTDPGPQPYDPDLEPPYDPDLPPDDEIDDDEDDDTAAARSHLEDDPERGIVR